MRLRIVLLSLVFLLSTGLSYSVNQVWQHKEDRKLAHLIEKSIHAASPGMPELMAKDGQQKGMAVPLPMQSSIQKILKKLPVEHARSIKRIELKYDSHAPRGLGSADLIQIKSADISAEEFTAVLIHEIGHSVDLGYLESESKKHPSEFKDGEVPIYLGDPSLEFYRISWYTQNLRQRDASNMDFVSGYAMSDPFEDFAESYAFYVLHHEEFKMLASVNGPLQQKYFFLKNRIFTGQEFASKKAEPVNAFRRVWDVTLLPHDFT